MMQDIVNFFQFKSPQQIFWREHFNTLKKDLGVFKDFLEIFGLGSNEHGEGIDRTFVQKNYVDIGLKTIKQLENILIGSPDIISELERMQNLSALSQNSQAFILDRLELFKENAEFRFCCEQLITDLCTALNETSVKYNKEFRNYLEHIDDIFETGKRDIKQGNFFEMLNYITDVKRRLIIQFGIDSSPQLKQESGPSSVATTNSIAAENTPLFNKNLERTFFGMFSRENSALKEQKKQLLQRKYYLTDLSAPQLARGLRNAAVKGRLDDLKYFITLGANIDANDNIQKKTALHHALEKRHMPCVHWLIEKGANCNIADASETTAYDYARKHNLDISRHCLQM